MNNICTKQICAAALICSFVISSAHLARAETATLTFSGHITEVMSTPPDPFEQTAVGNPWTCTYTFDPNTRDVDGSDQAGQYQDTIARVVLTIGTPIVSGIPGQGTNAIYVNLTSGYADYSATMGLPDGSARAQIVLKDNDGTPFESDALPAVLPSPLDVAFPNQREFLLRQAGNSQVILRGVIGQTAVSTISQLRTDIQINNGPEYKTLDLLVDSQAFGPGGVASGLISCPGCEVMGVEPSPFRWVVDPQVSTPADGTPAITFDLDSVGAVAGVGQSPFAIFLEVDSEILGELDFNEIGGSFPSVLGSLDLEGLNLILPNSRVSRVESFEAFDAFDEIAAANTKANFRVSMGQEYSTIDVIVDSQLYGPGGMASGLIDCPGCEVMGVEPSPFRWVVDPVLGIPEDGTVAVKFTLDDSGEVMGVEPSPFRIVAATETAILGLLDFSQVSGHRGSIHLEGVRIELPDGSFIPVDNFTAQGNQVQIDIKPGSDQNTINLSSSGVIPVAIMGSETFDATTVDPETVNLAGASVKLKGKSGKYLASIEDVNDDGLDDLLCKVMTKQLLIEPGASTAALEAQTYEGMFVSGTDIIRIVSD